MANRNIEINGVVGSVSDDGGCIITWGTKSDIGSTVHFFNNKGSGYVSGTFVEYGNKIVAIMPHVEPGDYRSYGSGETKVVPGYISQTQRK